MIANTHCPECGYNFAAFGTVHRRIPRMPPAQKAVEAPPEKLATHKYRDVDKWRAYIRVI